jgi:hypothetical protein
MPFVQQEAVFGVLAPPVKIRFRIEIGMILSQCKAIGRIADGGIPGGRLGLYFQTQYNTYKEKSAGSLE